MLPNGSIDPETIRPALRWVRSSGRPLMRRVTGVVLGLALLSHGSVCHAAEGAFDSFARLRQKQTIDTRRLGIARPGGLTYSGDAGVFLVLGVPDIGARPAAFSSVALVSMFRERVGSVSLPVAVSEPRAMAYDDHSHRLLLWDVAGRSLYAIPADGAGGLDSGGGIHLEGPRVGPVEVVGMAVDPAGGEVFVLDGLTRRILRFTPEAAAVPEARWIDLGSLAGFDLRGLA